VFCIWFLLLLGELLVDEVDLVAILNDLVVLEKALVGTHNFRQVLEIEVERVQTKLGEETLAEVRARVDPPNLMVESISVIDYGSNRANKLNHIVVTHEVVNVKMHVVHIRQVAPHGTTKSTRQISEAFNVVEVEGLELKGICPVRVLKVINDSLRVRTHLAGVELHGGINERLQTLSHLLGVDLVAVLHEFIHLVGRKECGHFVCLGLCYPYSAFPNPFSTPLAKIIGQE